MSRLTKAKAARIREQGLPICQEDRREYIPGRQDRPHQGPCPFPPADQFLPTEDRSGVQSPNIIKQCNNWTEDVGDLWPDTADPSLKWPADIHGSKYKYICSRCIEVNANGHVNKRPRDMAPAGHSEFQGRAIYNRLPVCRSCEKEAIRHYPFGNGRCMCQVRLEEGRDTGSLHKGPRCWKCIYEFCGYLGDLANDYRDKLQWAHKRPRSPSEIWDAGSNRSDESESDSDPNPPEEDEHDKLLYYDEKRP